MDVGDYARLRDHLENVGAIRPDGSRNEFRRVGTSARRIRGSEPTLRKRQAMGTNGKLGVGAPIGTTAGDGSRALSRSAESQYFGKARAEAALRVASRASVLAYSSERAELRSDVADVLASW